MTAMIIVAIVLLAVIAWMCFRAARLHMKLAGAYQLIADMLRADANEQQVRLAESHRAREETAIRGL